MIWKKCKILSSIIYFLFRLHTYIQVYILYFSLNCTGTDSCFSIKWWENMLSLKFASKCHEKLVQNFELEYLYCYYANISKSCAHAKTANKRKYTYMKTNKLQKRNSSLEMEFGNTRKCFVRKWLWYINVAHQNISKYTRHSDFV